MGAKKIVYYLLICVAVLSLFGCKKHTDSSEDNKNLIQPTPTITLQPTEDAQQTENHEGEMRSYLSGLWVSKEVGMKRPYAYVFNNFNTVSNQWGIGQADIVYEALVEGGITRFLGIGENYSGNRLGSTRSARHYFVSIADEYDAIYIHFGGTKYAYSKIKELGVDELDGLSGLGSTVFYRDRSIRAPHNAFASVNGILKGIKRKGIETQYPEGYQPHFSFYKKDTDLANGSGASKINLDFSYYIKPYFEYNAQDKLYYRFQFGAAHKDSLTGKQLAFKNIIIQFVKEWNIDKKGYQTMDLTNAGGSGYYITNGKAVPITWKKKEASSWMRYYNKAGEELTINPGKTYITLFPVSRPEDVTIK